MRLSTKWIWITGASSGIGRALAVECARRDANLVLLARNEAGLQETKSLCTGKGEKVIQQMDLESNTSMEEAANILLSRHIPIDILINNGGISQRSFALDTTEATGRRIFDINYFGTIYFTKLLLPEMIKNGHGHIAVTTSLVGHIGSPKRTTYAASKHALHGYFDSLRAELFDSNIKVTLMCPGFIRTNISLSAVTGDGTQQNMMDEKTGNGMDPARLAVKAINGIEREKEEIYIGGVEILAIYLKRFVPGIFSKILRKAKVT